MDGISADKRLKGITYALISPIVSGVATVFIAAATKILPPFFVTSISGLMGAFVIWLTLLAQSQRLPLAEAWKARWLIVKLSFQRGVIGAILFVFGLFYTDAVKAVFFTKIEPYFVLMWGFLLRGERISRKEFALLCVHLFGAFLLSTSGNISAFDHSQLGDLLILLSMAISGYSYADAKALSAKVGARGATVFSSGTGGLLLLPFALYYTDLHFVSEVSSKAWLFLWAHVILFDAIALPLWFLALHSVPGWIVSALRAVGPLAGVPAAYFLLGEKLNLAQAIGGVFVVITSASIAVSHFRAAAAAAKLGNNESKAA